MTALFVCMLVLLPFVSGCTERRPEPLTFSGPTMGTHYNITLVPAHGVESRWDNEKLQADIDALLHNINLSMSTYIADSELSRFNQSAVGQWFSVSTDLVALLQISQKLSALTDGHFDPTVGPLVNLWGFGPADGHAQAPTTEEIEAGLDRVGYQLLMLDYPGRRIKKQKELYLDLSAIAKGHAVDKLAEYFIASGWQRFMIEIGGEVRALGKSHRDQAWRIGIEVPSLLQSDVMQAISIEHGAIATSGDYRNYREVDGQRLSHTINPSTGRPVTHSLASVTVVSDSAAYADALATALNVMGPDAGFLFAEKHHVAAFFIIRESSGFTVKYSTEFEPYRVSL